FTPNTLINFVASLSHIRPKYYFIVLASSKLVSTIILGYLGKDIILHLIKTYGVDFGTGYALEFTGETIKNLSMDGRMTICNM
ncbi:aconitase family protein, partial [Staphylococcus aureus]|nr:aconitase family protein [Staphylococcus aureus]